MNLVPVPSSSQPTDLDLWKGQGSEPHLEALLFKPLETSYNPKPEVLFRLRSSLQVSQVGTRPDIPFSDAEIDEGLAYLRQESECIPNGALVIPGPDGRAFAVLDPTKHLYLPTEAYRENGRKVAHPIPTIHPEVYGFLVERLASRAQEKRIHSTLEQRTGLALDRRDPRLALSFSSSRSEVVRAFRSYMEEKASQGLDSLFPSCPFPLQSSRDGGVGGTLEVNFDFSISLADGLSGNSRFDFLHHLKTVGPPLLTRSLQKTLYYHAYLKANGNRSSIPEGGFLFSSPTGHGPSVGVGSIPGFSVRNIRTEGREVNALWQVRCQVTLGLSHPIDSFYLDEAGELCVLLLFGPPDPSIFKWVSVTGTSNPA